MFHPLANLDRYEVILASGSPRRRELLAMLDIDFTVDTSHPVDETVPEGMKAEEIPLYLSQLKAAAYPLADDGNKLVITADTVVILDDMVLGKPEDLRGAADMLAMLQNRTQRVVTGVTIRTSTDSVSFSAESEVEFGALTPEEIAYYVERYSPLDKAGAYGIQEWIDRKSVV